MWVSFPGLFCLSRVGHLPQESECGVVPGENLAWQGDRSVLPVRESAIARVVASPHAGFVGRGNTRGFGCHRRKLALLEFVVAGGRLH